MAYQIEFNRRAAKEFQALSAPLYTRVRSALEALREEPRPAGSVKLKGWPNAYRVRVSAYRIVYEVDDATRVIVVKAIQHRKDVYRDL